MYNTQYGYTSIQFKQSHTVQLIAILSQILYSRMYFMCSTLTMKLFDLLLSSNLTAEITICYQPE